MHLSSCVVAWRPAEKVWGLTPEFHSQAQGRKHSQLEWRAANCPLLTVQQGDEAGRTYSELAGSTSRVSLPKLRNS
eukprot:2644013-Pleurochrysis_carterae.AAC.1